MDARELYTQLILEHSRHPRHFGALDCPTCSAKGNNPLCGDRITISVNLNAEKTEITDVKFSGSGCAISVASASLMASHLIGKTCADAQALFTHFHHALTAAESSSEDAALPEKLQAFMGVKQFPMRVKCATLAWHTFDAALKGKQGVSTE